MPEPLQLPRYTLRRYTLQPLTSLLKNALCSGETDLALHLNLPSS